MLKETWGKRDGFKFGFGTRSKADNPEENGSVSKITGSSMKQTRSEELKVDNSVPLFVKSLWDTRFKKDEIADNYEIDSENRVTKKWESSSDEVENPNFSLTKPERPERRNYNDDYGEVEEINDDDIAIEEEEYEGKVYEVPSSSEGEGDGESVP